MESPDHIFNKLLDSGFERVTYEEFEKAMTNPDADPELLRAVLNEMEPAGEYAIEDIEVLQGAYEESPMVRPSFPKTINVEWKFEG